MRSTALSMAGALLAAAALPASAPAATILVDDDRAECPAAAHRAIQPAVDAAGDGDVVRVCRGTYRGQVLVGDDKAGLVLEAVPRRSAVLLAPARMDTLPRALVYLRAPDAILRGFRIIGPLAPNAACGDSLFTHDVGVQVTGSDVLVEDNQIHGIRDTCGNGEGIWVGDAQNEIGAAGGSGAVIRGNLVEQYWRTGVMVEATDVSIVSNTILGAQSRPFTVGISAGQESLVHAEDNDVHSNQATGISLGGAFSGGHVARGNRLRGNGVGIRLGAEGPSTVDGNAISAGRSHGIVDETTFVGGSVIAGNVVADNVGHGILLRGVNALAVSVVEGNQVLRNRGDGVRAEFGGYRIEGTTALGNLRLDCHDLTGSPSANTWTANRGRTSSPSGLCTP